jgi:hypothetical protein
MEESGLPTGARRAQWDRVTGLHLKEGFEFGEMVWRTYERVLAEMLEKLLVAYIFLRLSGCGRGFQSHKPL